MNRLDEVRDAGRSAASAVLERVGRGMGRMQERKPLPCDILESDDAYLVVFDAPGATGSDVQVRFVDGEVQVRVDRFRDVREGFELRFPGRGLSLDGSARLPADAAVDAEAAEAVLTDRGTLEVRVPKAAEAGTVPVTEAVPEAEDATRSDDVTDGDTARNGDERDDE